MTGGPAAERRLVVGSGARAAALAARDQRGVGRCRDRAGESRRRPATPAGLRPGEDPLEDERDAEPPARHRRVDEERGAQRVREMNMAAPLLGSRRISAWPIIVGPAPVHLSLKRW